MQSLETGTIKFCATGKSGLGHLRRVSNIAAAIRKERPELKLILVTNAPAAGLSAEDHACFSEIVEVPRDRMASLLSALPRGPVVIDTAIIPSVEALSDPLALILRETVDAKLPAFRLANGRRWDAVIVPSPKSHWQPDNAVIGTKALTFAGWISRATKSCSTVLPAEIDGAPRLLIATGGGGTKETASLLRDEIDAIASHLRTVMPGVTILQAAGPRLPSEGRLSHADQTIDVGSRLNEAFAEADAVISTVGYNSVLELAGLATPALLVPIARTFDDQVERARLWGPKLGRAHEQGESAASAEWLAAVLRRKLRRTPLDLGHGAAETAARAILSLVPAPAFEKPVKSPARARAIVAASHHIETRGGPVVDLAFDEGRELLIMPRIDAQDLRKIAVTRLRCAGVKSLDAVSEIFSLAMGELAAFHRAGLGYAPAAGLDAFDPFAKIKPRLTYLCIDEQRARVTTLAETLAQRLAKLGSRPGAPLTQTIVHGDFHVGQVLAANDTADVHIIDLDDIALGCPEADVGNFAAHVVTSASLYEGPIREGLASLLAGLSIAYHAASGPIRLDPAAVMLYASAALLRRLLKLYVAGRDIARHPEILAAAEHLSDEAASAIQRASILAAARTAEARAADIIQHQTPLGTYSQ